MSAYSEFQMKGGNMSGTFPNGIKPVGYQQLTVSTAAVGFTIPKGAIRARVNVQDQSIRWRDDGIDPSAIVGMLQKADTYFDVYDTQELKAFKAIRVDGSDAKLNISYYG